MNNEYAFLNKLILFHVEAYIDMEIKADVAVPSELCRLKLGIIPQRTLNKFTIEESKWVTALAEN